MRTAKTRLLTGITASVDEFKDEHARTTRTGKVAVWAAPSWLRGDAMVAATLTPAEARRLALRLLQAAEDAER